MQTNTTTLLMRWELKNKSQRIWKEMAKIEDNLMRLVQLEEMSGMMYSGGMRMRMREEIFLEEMGMRWDPICKYLQKCLELTLEKTWKYQNLSICEEMTLGMKASMKWEKKRDRWALLGGLYEI